MAMFLVGLALFLALHSLSIVAPDSRDRLAARLGEGPWKGLYSLLSLAGLVLLVAGFAAARGTSAVLYSPPVALRYVALALMLPVFPMVLAAFLPGRVGATLKHPLLLATKTWALAHLLANGTLLDVILFGALLAWAVANRIALKHRPARTLPSARPGRFNDLIAVGLGLALYAAFLGGLHRWLIGVSPLG